ncbi:glycosyltransferase, partial [Kaistella carnis]
MRKLIRITTVPLSLDKLLGKQLSFMNQFYEVTAISADEKELQRVAKKYGVKNFHVQMTRQISPIQDLLALWKLYRFLRREKPELVHSHTPKAGIVGMMAAFFAGVPHRFHTVAGLPLMEAEGLKRKILNAVESLTYRFATKVYPNSFGLQDIILKEGFCSPEKLKVLGKGSSNGIDTSHFNRHQVSPEHQEQLRLDLGIQPEDFV